LDPLVRAIIGEEALNQPTRPNAKTPAQILDWLGLDALLPYAFAFQVEPDEMRGTGRFGFSRETPISRILIEPTTEPAPMPPFLNKDFSQVSSMRWSLPRAIRQMDPQLAMGIAMGKGFLTGQLGMDVQTQFLDHFGDGMVFVQEMDAGVMEKMMKASQNQDTREIMALTQAHPTNGQNYLLGLEVKNLQAISGALNTLLSKAHPGGLPGPEMFRGHPVHNPVPENAGAAGRGLIRYTFLDNYLLIAVGNPTLLHQAITASGDPQRQLANDREFQQLLDRFPRAQMFEYASGQQQAAAWDIISTSLGGLLNNPADAPDFSAFAEVIQGSVSVTNRQGTIFEMKSSTTFIPPE
jgi:hypothetical protein